MDIFETFKKLSDSEQLKIFETLLNNSKKNIIDAVSQASQANSPERSDGCGEAEDSKKKQRTLDSWLIKSSDTSPCKNKPDESLHQTKLQGNARSSSEINNETESPVNLIPTIVNSTTNSTSCSINNTPSKNQSTSCPKPPHCESDIVVDNGPKSIPTSSSGVVNKKSNLTSKRKCLELSPVAECTSPIKRFKDKHNLTIADDNLNCCVLLNGESVQSQITCVSDVSHPLGRKERKSSKDTCNLIKHIEENHLHNNNLDISLDNGNYNLRTKRKNLKLQNSPESNIEPDGAVIIRDSNKKINNVASKSNNHKINSSSQSNYEAFHKLADECSKIGLNVMDILQHEKIQNILEDREKISNEAVIFLGSFTSSNNTKLPIVHLIKSKQHLLEAIEILQKSS